MRIFLFLFLCSCCIYSRAQIRFGVQAGYSRVNWASIKATSSDLPLSYTTSALSGFQAGVVAEVDLSEKLSLRPALFVSSKGTKLDRQSWFDTSSRGIWIGYIEMPVTVVYRVTLSRRVTVFTGGGLYAAQAFSGIEKGEEKTSTGEYGIYNEVQFGTHNDGPVIQMLPTIIKPFDYGFIVLAGAELKTVQLLLTYSRGLKALLPNGKPYNGNYTNSVLTVSVAYLISTRHIKQ